VLVALSFHPQAAERKKEEKAGRIRTDSQRMNGWSIRFSAGGMEADLCLAWKRTCLHWHTGTGSVDLALHGGAWFDVSN